jgi:heat shock protein HslJ
MKRYAPLIVLTSLLAIGCDDSPTAPSDIIGDTWQLFSIKEGNAAEVLISDRSRYTLTLTNEGRAQVRADCNVCIGGYSLDGSNILIEPLTCTRAFCGDESHDEAFLQGLLDAETFHATGDQLTTTGDDFTLHFVS